MTDYQATLLAVVFIKAVIVLSGTACIFMGYRLFTKGVYRGGAALHWKDIVSLDKGGPGLIFAAFGAIVLVVGIQRDGNIESKSKSADGERNILTEMPSTTPAPTMTDPGATPSASTREQPAYE